MRLRVRQAFDVFHDVRSLGDEEIAALARRDGIDIAVDLKGYTKDTRTGVFAHRAAPVQISYLGYPGTMGAPFMDYLVADRTVIPEAQRQHYSEKLIYLPHSYQANDDTREIAQPAPTRREAGLPPDGFVFCCFNNSYKITAAEFDIWMRLLGSREGSVLWLLKTNASAEQNLRKQAQRHRIDPERLIFAERAPPALHLARHGHADLFLDTFLYNAHTTASDALWAGLPLVTVAGKGFASRVAASLLQACGLAELVADSPERYEQLAQALAADPQKLASLRAKLAANRRTAPLFRSKDFVRQLEKGFDEAWRRSHDSDARDIQVPEL
jgi:predicted O-linked N-acetylglucosamine transferase (SPINDLY family)